MVATTKKIFTSNTDITYSITNKILRLQQTSVEVLYFGFYIICHGLRFLVDHWSNVHCRSAFSIPLFWSDYSPWILRFLETEVYKIHEIWWPRILMKHIIFTILVFLCLVYYSIYRKYSNKHIKIEISIDWITFLHSIWHIKLAWST